MWSTVAPDGGERRLQILERLRRLRAKIAGSAGELAVNIEAELAGDIDDAAGAGHLDHMGVSGRRGHRGRIEETDVVDQARPPGLRSMAANGPSPFREHSNGPG